MLVFCVRASRSPLHETRPMARLVSFLLTLVLIVLDTGPLPGQEKALAQALALQTVMQKAIRQAEPSIACVLVSRNPAHVRGAGPDSSGQLGDFDPEVLGFLGDEKSKEERRKLDLADPGHIPEAFGSGVVIDARGLVLTNYHVIRDATKIFLRLPGGKASYADIHAADPRSDLAVLRFRDNRQLPLRSIPLGDAALIERGQFILTLA